MEEAVAVVVEVAVAVAAWRRGERMVKTVSFRVRWRNNERE